jgi:hypothetical protein
MTAVSRHVSSPLVQYLLPIAEQWRATSRTAQHLTRLDREPMPIQQDAEREHYLEAFRRAGLD